MHAKLNETEIENYAIELLENLGYEHIYAPNLERNFSDVLLKERLLDSLIKINPKVNKALIEDAIKEITHIEMGDVLSSNEQFHAFLIEGVKVDKQEDGITRGEVVRLIDFDNVSNNEFVVANQFSITENNHTKRPDIILFINGIPLVVIELKNPTDENATIHSAFNQIQTYKEMIPSLFVYNAICAISDGVNAKAGSVSSNFNRFMTWKIYDENHTLKPILEIEMLINGLLSPNVLLDYIHSFIVFEKTDKIDENGVVSIEIVKKIAAYHQYYAVNKAVRETKRASGENGDRKAGVVWHTQGSGKSLSMAFYAGKMVLSLQNPTIVVITDRNDLDDQLFSTFANCSNLLRQEPMQVESREDLKEKLRVNSGGIIFTTIQKFQPNEGNVFDELSSRKNIIVMADEAHRTQYGFQAKTIDEKDESGKVIGKKVVYGFAKYLRDALPNATYIGFSGTPIESKDANTPLVFGNYIDTYDIAQAVEDGATVKIYYESRLAKINLSDEGRELIRELDNELSSEDADTTQQAKARWTQLEALIGSKDRIKEIAKDIILHFEERLTASDGKGMIVAMSRRIAVELYDEIIALRPQWHSDDLNKGVIKVVMTASSSDGPKLSKHHTTKEQRRMLGNRMKDSNNELKLVIVRDMWLTGFDAPCMHTIYIDKPMKGHNLMQAIARVNRVYKDKPAGLVVDYLGIASDLKVALSFYSKSGGRGDPYTEQEQAVEIMKEKLDVVSSMFSGFDYKPYFHANTREKLTLILDAQEHILSLEDGKNRFIKEVNALSSAFAIAVPHEKAMEIKDEVAFFQAVKARLVKYEDRQAKSSAELETTIRQVIDKALVTDKVIDIFDASGIKKPDISIFSDEFLLEVKNMKHKNIALETLKRLLEDEIKVRSKINLVQSKTLMEMLENSIKRYHNKSITAVEVINELIELSKEIRDCDKEAHALNLSEFEYAFYTAIASNNSAQELMGKDKLRELAIYLTDEIRKNITIDWTIKKSARAMLLKTVKRALKKFGYPPDMEQLAVELVLRQAEMIADEVVEQ